MKTSVKAAEQEYSRVQCVSGLDLDYDRLQEELGSYTRLAAAIAGTKIALINIIDLHTQWTVSGHGLGVMQLPREQTACQYTILNSTPHEIKRLDLDARFQHLDYIAGKGGLDLKYYLGIPLQMESGVNIGALCMLDKEEKDLSTEVKDQLKIIARQIAVHLELKRKLNDATNKAYEESRRIKKIAHDVRSPITGIQGISLLALENDLDLEECREFFGMIAKSSAALLELSEHILKEKEVTGPDETSIKELADKIVHLYKPQAESKNINFEVTLNQEIERDFIHKKNLLQIIGNLVSNAIKFTPKGGAVLLTFALDPFKKPKTLEINVEDSGLGFSTEKINSILKGKATSSRGSAGEAGFGLGLKLVQSLLAEVNGTIEVSSNSDTGGRFTVNIPQ